MKVLFVLVSIISFNISAEDKKNETPKEVIKEESKKKPFELEITPEERQILEDGEISTTRYVVGGILGTYPLGLGIGHAVVGKYSEKGWIFTVGQLGSAMIFVSGVSSCFEDYDSSRGCGTATLGLYALVGFRIWEIIDIWTIVPKHNRKYRSLKKLKEKYEMSFSPTLWKDSAGMALTLRF